MQVYMCAHLRVTNPLVVLTMCCLQIRGFHILWHLAKDLGINRYSCKYCEFGHDRCVLSQALWLSLFEVRVGLAEPEKAKLSIVKFRKIVQENIL